MPEALKPEIKLFYCYAHEDKALRDKLQVHLSDIKRRYRLTNWYDREILPGENWEQAIDHHLATADVILLLISPDFLASDYCYGREMQRALERHRAGTCCVIPILLRLTYWEETPFSSIQLLPTDARPITRWTDPDEAFYDVVKGISTAIKALLISRKTKAEEYAKEGYALSNLKRYEEALAAFEQAVAFNPNDATTYSNKGYALNKLKRYEEALATCEQAIDLDPNDGVTYSNKGHALRHLGKAKEAEHVFEQARQLGYYG